VKDRESRYPLHPSHVLLARPLRALHLAPTPLLASAGSRCPPVCLSRGTPRPGGGEGSTGLSARPPRPLHRSSVCGQYWRPPVVYTVCTSRGTLHPGGGEVCTRRGRSPYPAGSSGACGPHTPSPSCSRLTLFTVSTGPPTGCNPVSSHPGTLSAKK
jgi:hypothetical protein